MNHPQKGIFTPGRNEPLTGRNANIQPSMFKRKQIFEKTPTERSEPPFSGYSFTGSSVTENLSLARSQVSQITQESFARMFREQMEKNRLGSMSETSEESLKYKNELNIIRIEIRGIKQSYHEFNKSFKKKLQEQNQTVNQLRKQISSQSKQNGTIREDVCGQLEQKIQQVEQGIAVKMRLIFTKMQEDLRKELTNYANRQFVPTSFLDDLDKQLNELDDRIANIESQYEANKTTNDKENMTASKVDRDASVILSSGSELKLKQFERDLSNLKKELDQNSSKIQQIDHNILLNHQTYSKQIKQTKELLNDLASNIKDRQKQFEDFKTHLESKIEIDKNYLLEKIDTDFEVLNKKLDQQTVLKSLTLSNTIEALAFRRKNQSTSLILEGESTQSQISKFQETRDESKLSALSSQTHKNLETICHVQNHQRISPSPKTEKTLSSLANEALVNLNSPKKSKKITITYGASQKTAIQPYQNEPLVGASNPLQTIGTSNIKEPQSLVKEQQQTMTLYKVDRDGYLMDINNKYILSSSNSMIFVSQKQIQAMEKTNLIKVQRWNAP